MKSTDKIKMLQSLKDLCLNLQDAIHKQREFTASLNTETYLANHEVLDRLSHELYTLTNDYIELVGKLDKSTIWE